MRVKKWMEKQAVSLSPALVTGLLSLQRYRLLSVAQFARVSGLSVSHLREVLRRLERKGYLGSVGNTGLRGGAKSPKLYYLTRRGYDLLCAEGGFAEDVVGTFIRPHTNTSWSPVMAHRMAVIDMLLAVEVGVAEIPGYKLVATFHEYRRLDGVPETSDMVSDSVATKEKIVPDAAFVLENVQKQTCGLFMVEVDRGTERIESRVPGAYSIAEKFSLYERYLRGGRFRRTYAAYGDFRFFTLLFISTTPARLRHCRDMSGALNRSLHPYFRLGIFSEVVIQPFSAVWLSRDVQDSQRTNIVQI